LANYYQGTWDHPGYLWGSPITFATDLAEVGARSILSYVKQLNLLAGSRCFGEAWRGDLPWYCGSQPDNPPPSERNPHNDPCQEKIEPKGFKCIKNTSTAALKFDTKRWDSLLLGSLKLVSIPVIDPLGYRAWNSMISRTRFAMRKPCKDDVWGKGSCEPGPVYELFKRIDERLEDKEITLIGHSMGAIVASEVVSEFPKLPYRYVVFLGAAVSKKEFANSVERVLYERVTGASKDPNLSPEPCNTTKLREQQDVSVTKVKPFCFFSVSLHPYAEATEENGFGAAPAGSLLEWIDTNFTQPADVTDRTLGRWANIAPLRVTFKQALIEKGYVHFKRFGLDLKGPHSHGGLANPNESGSYGAYWRPEYWN